jgi:branched-chain amino acid transport system ATP-binding protein
MLEVRDIHTYYGDSHVLHGVSLSVADGEIVTLLGRNGMGKTTTIKSITGIVPPRSGTIHFGGREIQRLPSYRVAKAGVGLVPEGRQIFPNLTVRENLVAMAANRSGSAHPWTLDEVFDLFPRLREREDNLGTELSGGEQQMLAVGRALMTNPRLLILDEATEGLAPLLRQLIWQCIVRLKARRQAILLVDRNTKALAEIADQFYVMEKGRIVWHGGNAEFRANPQLRERYLGV